MLLTDRKCSRCVHFHFAGPLINKEGACLAHPPAAFPVVTPTGQTTILTVWPQLKGDQVCGEFRSSWTDVEH